MNKKDSLKIAALEPDQLHNTVDPGQFDFKSTEDIESLEAVIGQQRAVQALEMGLEISDPSYNIFVTGLPATGKTTLVKDILNRRSASESVPEDWVMVHNFDDAFRPVSFPLPVGEGKKFQRKMDQFIQNLKEEMPRAFETEDYQKKRNQLMEKFQQKKRKKISALQNKAAEHNVKVQFTGAGIQTIPIVNDQPIKQDAYQKLDDDLKEQVDKNLNYVQREIQNTLREINKLENELQEKIQALNKEVTLFVVGHRIENFKEEYQDHKEVLTYLEAVKNDIIENTREFVQASEGGKNKQRQLAALLKGGGSQGQPDFTRYNVNLLVDNTDTEGAPVIVETNPTYNNVFGRLEKRAKLGAVYSDFTMVKAGSLIQANGGYLVLDILGVLKNPFVWDTLKRAIKNREIQIEDIQEQLGYVTVSTLKPQAIPINVRLVLIGDPQIFTLLQHFDNQFEKTFKVRADFDYEVNKQDDTVQQYVRFIAKVCREENLTHFSPDGVSAMIEASQKTVEDQEKLSLRFGKVVEIIKEAHYWASKNGHDRINRADVEKAHAQRKYRSSLIEEKVHENILRDIQMIATDGQKVGQVNALSVFAMDGFLFGRPSRITAETYMGKEGVVNIDRNVEMSGKTHNKGVEILTGWLGRQFAQDFPLTVNISLTFEQSYGMIDGDSASSTEAYAILSTLSGLPLKQNLAVTGSVNQKGEIQAIGAVNQKIEGFFDLCKSRGLTGNQGVIIPNANIKHLMLKSEVIEAVKDKQFHIYPVKTIAEGIVLLTDVEAGKLDDKDQYPSDSVFGRTKKRLEEYVSKAYRLKKKFGGKTNLDL